MTALYSVAEIRTIEQAAIVDLHQDSLMQRAGQAAATLGLTLISSAISQAEILIIAGPGNNGGDALECAHILAQAGTRVKVFLYADPSKYSPESSLALQRAQNSTAQFLEPVQDLFSSRTRKTKEAN